MDKGRIVDSAKVVAGKAKAAIESAIGGAKTQAEGKTDQVAGCVQNAVGSAKDTLRDAIKGK